MSNDETERTTIEIDTTVIDATDLSMLGTGTIGDGAVEVAGEPNDAGTLPERVRVRGTLEVVRMSTDGDS